MAGLAVTGDWLGCPPVLPGPFFLGSFLAGGFTVVLTFCFPGDDFVVFSCAGVSVSVFLPVVVPTDVFLLCPFSVVLVAPVPPPPGVCMVDSFFASSSFAFFLIPSTFGIFFTGAPPPASGWPSSPGVTSGAPSPPGDSSSSGVFFCGVLPPGSRFLGLFFNVLRRRFRVAPPAPGGDPVLPRHSSGQGWQCCCTGGGVGHGGQVWVEEAKERSIGVDGCFGEAGAFGRGPFDTCLGGLGRLVDGANCFPVLDKVLMGGCGLGLCFVDGFSVMKTVDLVPVGAGGGLNGFGCRFVEEVI